MKFLANIFLHIVHPHDDATHSSDYRQEESHFEMLAQGTEKQHPAAQTSPATPSRQEVLNYLGELAKDYHLPPKLVYSVAMAESSLNPAIDRVPNYFRDKNHHLVHDQQGNPVIKTYDYGLMQINSARIGHDVVKDSHGHPFKIGEDVTSDWRANARAGVAVLAPAYHLAELEQGSGATDEDHAQQAYSQYNGGGPRARDRYLKEKHGLPENGADRNFVKRYREATDIKR